MNTAAFSIDDLVSSLNGNHIGEDANNLKALHVRLHQPAIVVLAVVAYCLFAGATSRDAFQQRQCTAHTISTVFRHWPTVQYTYDSDTVVEHQLLAF